MATPRHCRIVFASGHRETLVLDLRDPFARMDVLPLERAYGKVESVTFAEPVERVDAASVFPHHTRLSRSLSR